MDVIQRRFYVLKSDPDPEKGVAVYFCSDGRMFKTGTLEAWQLTDEWVLQRTENTKDLMLLEYKLLTEFTRTRQCRPRATSATR